MLRWALPAAVFILAATGQVLAGVTVTLAGKGYDIDIDGQASASELLEAITSATGATVKGQPEDTTINGNHLRGTSLERALRLLLPGAAFTIRFSGDDRPAIITFLSPDGAGTSQDGGNDAASSPPDDPSMAGSDGSDPADDGDTADPQ